MASPVPEAKPPPLRLDTQLITPHCREGRGNELAWEEAVMRLRAVYEVQVARSPQNTLELSIASSKRTAADL